MNIKRWMNCSQSFTKDKKKMYIRRDKIKLKALLMKDIKTDDKGRTLLTKDDEWIKETEWDELYKDNDIKNIN
ncbi:hypothetical protein EXM90_11885 [Clostridium botulinum]|uniref:hypothetical protein n=1 Tax=Clostridium botulinum TaxID=1491 RepID=UPI00077359AE|nr:hypothetical protein [Clostridium botulinum]MBN3451416.1 hypothetical protein [Clostridium botulinum]NFB64599.1 hypothetical protein [Clostridium botulinum]NFB82127.1 hypothetical protein [Clostridium botulinum]NFC02240.1 hypothetical protein [Clostridium botulinum]NFC09212.1 hypothetical protein [Clostridium botulinum]